MDHLPTVLACEAITRAGSWSWYGYVSSKQTNEEIASGVIPEGQAAAELAPALHQALQHHGRPDRLAVARGPGSFTGLRVAITAMRTLAWIEQLPVVGVDTLAAIAAAQGPGCWWVWLPLKKDTTFHACYRVTPDGCEVISPITAQLDSVPLLCGAHHPDSPSGIEGVLSIPDDAVIIGPALRTKPHLLAQWLPSATSQGVFYPLAVMRVVRRNLLLG